MEGVSEQENLAPVFAREADRKLLELSLAVEVTEPCELLPAPDSSERVARGEVADDQFVLAVVAAG